MKTEHNLESQNLAIEVQTICASESTGQIEFGDPDDDTYTGLTLTSTVFF